MEITQGVIQEFNEGGKAIIVADIPDFNRALLRKYKNVLIGFSDGLKKTFAQIEKYSKQNLDISSFGAFTGMVADL